MSSNMPVTTDEKPHKVQILWGESPEKDDEPMEYAFKTAEELDAFLYGVSEAEGWMDYELIEPNPDGSWPESDKLKELRESEEED